MEYVEHQGLAVVLIGNFNPAIFNPDWLCRQGIVTAEEAAEARLDVIHPEIARFVVGDLQFDITNEKFTLFMIAEPYIRAADIVADLFLEKLAHTPLSALGINYYAHFRVRDWHQQTALGRALAPIEPWGDWGQTMDQNDLKKVGGLIHLTMQQSKPQDRDYGYIRTTVEPSSKIEAGRGVYVQVNDHYESGGDNPKDNFAEVCMQQITPSLERSRGIVASLSDLAKSL